MSDGDILKIAVVDRICPLTLNRLEWWSILLFRLRREGPDVFASEDWKEGARASVEKRPPFW